MRYEIWGEGYRWIITQMRKDITGNWFFASYMQVENIKTIPAKTMNSALVSMVWEAVPPNIALSIWMLPFIETDLNMIYISKKARISADYKKKSANMRIQVPL